MKLTKLTLFGFTLLSLFYATSAQSYSSFSSSTYSGDLDTDYNYWDQNYIVQALLGAVQYENLKFDVEDTTKEIDLSIVPQLGAGWGTLPRGDRFQYGLECSFLLGFMADDISFYAGGSGTYIKISTSMWMFDLAGGPYASLYVDKKHKVRIYLAAGPLITYADYQSEREEEASIPEDITDEESAFGLGVYARTGFEFRVYDAGMLGLGLRGSWANVDLSDVGGSSDLTGIAAFVSFTAGL